MEKLLTTKQISEMYEVSPYTITHNWCNKGLKFLRGKHTMLFKEKWVDDFIEEEAERQSRSRNTNYTKTVINKTVRNFSKTKFNSEMKII